MSIGSPLETVEVVRLGPVAITEAVVTTWGLVAGLALAARLATRRMSVEAPGTAQAVAEIVVETIGAEIRSITRRDPGVLLPLIGTLFLLLTFANLTSLIPGLRPPTARLETTGALAAIVFVSVHWLGIRVRGLRAHLGAFAKPTVIMLPLNVVSEITRTMSLMVRLFGNIMSGEFIVGIAVALAGLFVPVPFMALDVLVGLIQAYIFAVLATVFIASAMGEEDAPADETERIPQ